MLHGTQHRTETVAEISAAIRTVEGKQTSTRTVATIAPTTSERTAQRRKARVVAVPALIARSLD